MKIGSQGNYYRNEDQIDLYYIHNYGIDIMTREIWLVPNQDITVGSGEDIPEPGVEYSMATQFLKNMHILMNISDEPITVHMKTCGGDWSEGMAIYNMIKNCPCAVTLLNYTHARSMSSIIMCGADKRVMMPDSEFMFHHGTMSFEGTVTQFITAAEELKKSREKMLEVYIRVMKRDSKIWKDKTRKSCKEWLLGRMEKKEEVYLTASQAIANGFADELFDGRWDELQKYTEEQLTRWET